MKHWMICALLSLTSVGCSKLQKVLSTSSVDQATHHDIQSMKPIEENFIKKIAGKVGLDCTNLSKVRVDTTVVGMSELYEFMKKECAGEEPVIPEKLPAYCTEQVSLDHQPVGLAPGVSLSEEELLSYNLERCSCPVEYSLLAKEKSVYCERKVAVPQ